MDEQATGSSPKKERFMKRLVEPMSGTLLHLSTIAYFSIEVGLE